MNPLGHHSRPSIGRIFGLPRHAHSILNRDHQTRYDGDLIIIRPMDMLPSSKGVADHAPQDFNLCKFGDEDVLDWRRLDNRPRPGARHYHTQTPVFAKEQAYFIKVTSSRSRAYVAPSLPRVAAPLSDEAGASLRSFLPLSDEPAEAERVA